MRLCAITGGSWCPNCRYKTEAKLHDILIKAYPTTKRQAKFNFVRNPLTGKQLPFDFWIKGEHIIIELDGPQHFVQVANWQTPEETQRRDVFKAVTVVRKGYFLIRLLQEDVIRDKWHPKTFLKTIADLIDERKKCIDTIVTSQTVIPTVPTTAVAETTPSKSEITEAATSSSTEPQGHDAPVQSPSSNVPISPNPVAQTILPASKVKYRIICISRRDKFFNDEYAGKLMSLVDNPSFVPTLVPTVDVSTEVDNDDDPC